MPVRVAAPASLAEARVCESVESGHSNFSHGATLQVNSGVVATDGRFHDQVIDAVRTVLG